MDPSKTKILKFPTKYDATKVEQFITEYAEAVSNLEQGKRPKNIFVIEFFEREDSGDYNMFIGGAPIKPHQLVGILEIMKDMVMRAT